MRSLCGELLAIFTKLISDTSRNRACVPDVISSGAPFAAEKKVEVVLGVATRISRAMVGVLWSGGAQVQVAMGIHCGPLIAGVAGRTLLRYRLFGDTVNTCARIKGLAVKLSARPSGDEGELDKAMPGAGPSLPPERRTERAESSGGSHISSSDEISVTAPCCGEHGSSVLLSDAAAVALIRSARSHRLLPKCTPQRRSDVAPAYLDCNSCADMQRDRCMSAGAAFVPTAVTHRSDVGADVGAPMRPLDDDAPGSSRRPTGRHSAVGAAHSRTGTSAAGDISAHRPNRNSQFNGKRPRRGAILEVSLSEPGAEINAVSPVQPQDEQTGRRRESALGELQYMSTQRPDVNTSLRCGEDPGDTRLCSTVQLRNLGEFALKGLEGKIRVWRLLALAEDGEARSGVGVLEGRTLRKTRSSGGVLGALQVCERAHTHAKEIWRARVHVYLCNVCVCVCVCVCVRVRACAQSANRTPHPLFSLYTMYNAAYRHWPKKRRTTQEHDTQRPRESAAERILHTVPHSRRLHTCKPARVNTATARTAPSARPKTRKTTVFTRRAMCPARLGPSHPPLPGTGLENATGKRWIQSKGMEDCKRRTET